MPRRSDRIQLGIPETPEAPPRACEQPGCPNPGEFRAPKDRAHLNQYRWFCLEHVREYNRAWDYYKGMGPTEIESELRADSGWQRPTWPLGRLGGFNPFESEYLRDPLGVLRDTPLHKARREPPRKRDEAPPELRAALDVLGLTWPLEGTRQALPPGCEWRRPPGGGAAEGHQPRLQPAPPQAHAEIRRGPRPGGGRIACLTGSPARPPALDCPPSLHSRTAP